MAKETTPHQRRLIRSFYRNRDAIETQRLQEIVGEIYLAAGARRREQLWERAAGILGRTPDLTEAESLRILEARDVEALARIAADRFHGA